MYKSEIEKRLNKADYMQLPRLLEIGQSFENITDNNHYVNMLQIADTCGIKYLSFYKLNNNINISTIINLLSIINYSPNLPYIEGQERLSIAKVSITNSDFEIICNFYTTNEIWVKSADGRNQSLERISERRVVHIQYYSNASILMASIDPIGLGVSVSERLSRILEEIFDNYGINFNQTFQIIELENSIYDKIDNNEFRPVKISNKDEARNIEFHSEAKNPRDSLIDQDCYIKMKTNQLDINRMKLKNDSSNMIIELFAKDIIRIWNKSNWEQLDEFKRSFISVL